MSIMHIDISYDLVEGIFTILDGFVFKEVDEVTLTGTSGTASILNNGITRTATWHTSLTVTASDFVTANAAAYLASGVVLTSIGAKLIFTINVPGVRFTGGTTITNVTLTLSGSVSANDTTYPVYKSIPKPPAENYVYIGGVIQTVDGTKDEFIYSGTVQVRVVSGNLERPDKKLAQQILNVIRGLLLPTTTSVFSVGTRTLVVLKPGTFNELVEQDATAITKVNLIDQYDFIIQ